MKKYCILVICLVAVMMLSACSGDSYNFESVWDGGDTRLRFSSDDLYAGSAPWANVYSVQAVGGGRLVATTMPRQPDAPSGTTRPETQPTQSRHIIRTASTELATEYFEDVIDSLRQLPSIFDGYVESEQLFAHGTGRFTITMRIPSANFDNALQKVEGLADVRASNQTAEDVTDRFYDMTARLATRQIEEGRLLELIAASTDVHDLINLESRLSNTRLQIEMYTSQLTNLAGRIAYSTIVVTLFDAAELPPPVPYTLGERIGGAFGDSLGGVATAAQNFVVFVAGGIIPLVIWGAIIFVVVKVVIKLRRRRVVKVD